LLAQLPEAEAEALEEHVLQCETCCRAARTLKIEDPFLDALLEAQTQDAEGPESAVVDRLIERLRALRRTAGAGPWPAAGPDPAGLLGPPLGPDEIGRIGSYAVLKVLGTGGMAAVYLARQARPRRLVALKMLLAGAPAGGERLARFRAETAVVARLRHPNIVQIHEAGEHGGRPYYAMELLEGGTLAQKLAAMPLEPLAAARLLQTVAGAVHHAHHQGVVHRDLKPGNILLAADGTPKVADFGLAKSLAPDDDTTADYRTETGAILGTPAYMAPEQAIAGRNVGPAADTYALGAILYECLTGRPPFKAANVLETLEQVRSQDPVPVSRLQPKVPRDLQTICLKCLEKDPARRYASAQELADDLGRLLRGEPIRARPVSRRERLTKWVRRKPALAALLGVSALSLAALVAGGLVYNARLRAAVARAEAKEAETRRQYREAHDTLDHMLGRLSGQRLAEVPRLKELQRDLLEDALAYYQGILSRADSPDPAVRRDAALACGRAADIQQVLGQPETAAENYRRAVELIEGLPDADRADPATRSLLAACYMNWGMAAGAAGHADEAERHLRTALDIRERLVGERPDDPAAQSGLAQAEHNLAAAFQHDRPAEAEAHYGRALAIHAALVRDHPGEESYQMALAEDYVNLGLLYRQTGRDAKAPPVFAKAEELLRPLVDRHPADARYARSLVALYVNWSYLLAGAGHGREAVNKLDRAIPLAEAVLQKEPEDRVSRQRAQAAHGARAEIYEFLSRFADSAKDWDRVIELEDGPARSRWRTSRARVWIDLGDHARAAAEIEELAARPQATGGDLYYLAGLLAQAIAPARNDKGLSSAERERAAERYAGRAAALLRKLLDDGYFKDAGHAKTLRTDPRLLPLRGRDDFRHLLEAVGHK
jgi:tetratricopeptide (TPR) repeat protein